VLKLIIGVSCPLCDNEIPVDVNIGGTYLEKYFHISAGGENDVNCPYPRLYVEIDIDGDLDLDKMLSDIKRVEERGRRRSRVREKRDAELGIVEPQN